MRHDHCYIVIYSNVNGGLEDEASLTYTSEAYIVSSLNVKNVEGSAACVIYHLVHLLKTVITPLQLHKILPQQTLFNYVLCML